MGWLDDVAFGDGFGAGGATAGALDRAAQLRGDAGVLAALAARPGARLLRLRDGEPLVAGARLALARPAPGEAEGALFLGLVGGEGVWAAPGAGEPPDGAAWADLRGVMLALPPVEAELAATARALLLWHGSHGFCARCGEPTAAAQAGWRRDCPACGATHFPRTDPVAIMLVLRGDRALMGRSPGWPEGMWSCLAGFMEPGETLEAAVRREVMEEAGVRVGRVGYVASQPWPFPASLMLGAWGRAETEAIRTDPEEIEAAEWVDRARLLRVLAGRDGAMRAPRPGAIAGAMLRAWVAGRIG